MGSFAVGPILLATTSGGVLVLLGFHLVANRGALRAGRFLSLAAAYGLVRGLLVRAITEGAFGGAPPYALPAGGIQVAGVPLQEAVGWILGAILAAHLGAAILGRLGLRPAPARVAAIGAVVFVALSLAVESAAARAGWWSWTIPPSPPFPVAGIALVDWGFVAFDLLLPLLVLEASGLGRPFAVACLAFPLHFASHLFPGPIVSFLPLSIFDVVHVGIPLAVVLAATRERAAEADAAEPAERFRWIPAVAAGVVVAVTGLAASAGHPIGNPWSLPLLFLAVASVTRLPAVSSRISSSAVRAGAVLAALFVLVAVLVPDQIRRQRYEERIAAAEGFLAARDFSSAEAQLRAAATIRPERAAPRTLLALVRLGEERRGEARDDSDTALRLEPGSVDALRLRATIEPRRRQCDGARPFTARGRKAHPSNAMLVYLDEFSGGAAGPGRPPSSVAIELAQRRGARDFSALASLARSLRDEATAAECDRLSATRR